MALVEPLEFERLVVTRNPESTNAKSGQRLLGLLGEAFPGRLHEITTYRDPFANIEHVAEYLREGDIVAPFGGDSTVGQAAGAIALRDDLGPIPLAPLPLGHANQMALMLNTPLRYRRPVSILRRGRIVPMYPFVFRAEGRPEIEARLALFAIGIGITGVSALQLDTNEFRKHPLSRVPVLKRIPESQMILRGLRDSRPFRKDGLERVEVLLVNGRRAAKYGRFDVTLPDQAFALLELADKRPASLAPVLGRFAMQLTQPTERVTSRAMEFTVESVNGEPIIGQHDGQPFVIEPGKVTITRAERPIYVVTTRRSLYRKR
jgi:diacylglycerol kinase family enzyme